MNIRRSQLVTKGYLPKLILKIIAFILCYPYLLLCTTELNIGILKLVGLIASLELGSVYLNNREEKRLASLQRAPNN